MTPERIAELRRQLAVEVSLAAAGAKHPSFDIYAALADTLDALDAAERRAEEAGGRVCGECGALTKPCREWHGPVELAKRAEAAEAENRRLREALDVIATCPAEAVHLMPLAAQAALAGEVPRGE